MSSKWPVDGIPFFIFGIIIPFGKAVAAATTVTFFLTFGKAVAAATTVTFFLMGQWCITGLMFHALHLLKL
jgi:fumarate reductase subunit D